MRTDREFGYDLAWEKPLPLVPRRLRAEVPERVLKDGTVEIPLDEDARARPSPACSSGRRGDRDRPPALLREPVARAAPARARGRSGRAGCAVSISSEVNAEYREYERTNTTVVDAYIKPVMVRYIERLVSRAGVGRARPRARS